MGRSSPRNRDALADPAAIGPGSTSLWLMTAAGADIPDSVTSRRGMLPALAGLVAGLAYAAISLYWGTGGRWLLKTVGISLSQPGRAGYLAALLAVWGAAAVKAVAALLPLLAIGVWPRTADGGLRRLAFGRGGRLSSAAVCGCYILIGHLASAGPGTAAGKLQPGLARLA